jgi:DNA-binding ferritin-like protein
MSISQQYYDKLDILSEKFPGILEDFKKNYVIYNQHPEFQEYTNAFSSSKAAISSIIKDLFVLKNDVQGNINILNTENDDLTNNIDELKKINEELKKRTKKLYGTNNGADEMNDDAKEQFKYQYIKNLTMIFGNLLIICVMYSLFKK